MTTREEAAAKAIWKYDVEYGLCTVYAPNTFHKEEAQTALAAADAHDKANGVHRLTLDDATVERAARALFVIENPEADWEALPLNQWVTDIYRKRTRAVLAAAVQEGEG